MDHTEEHIEMFIGKVRTRLNAHLGLTTLIASLLFGSMVMTIIALCYILRGYHIPLFWYPVCFIGALSLGGCSWLYFRHSHDQAAKFSDNHFALKDSVRSFSGFHKTGKHAGFYKLQALQTENFISSLSTHTIKYKCPVYMLAIAIVLILTSGLMGFKDDSPFIQQKLAQEKFLLGATETINQEINDLIEQVQKELEEKNLDKIVDMNEVRQKAEELEETTDIKDAMRQYAQLERDLSGVLSKLSQRRDEQLLERMGKELKKDDETKALGNQLIQKMFKNASEELEKFKLDPKAAMEIQQSQLEKLKEMAARMAEEAQRSESGQNQQAMNTQNINSQQDTQNQQQNNSNKNQQSSGNRLSQMTQQLNQSAQKLSQMMQQQSQSMNNQGQNQQQNQQMQGQMQQMAQSINQNLGNMGQFLQQMDARRQAQSMMQSMLNSLSQSQMQLGQMPGMGQGQQQGQGQMAGQGQMPGQNGQNGQSPGSGDGGRDAGSGSSFSKNTEPGKDAPAGETTRLQGMLTEGSSTNSLEEAGSGTGSSLGTLQRDPQEYMQQVESFIRREDVPETVKAGVKAYFENIHKVSEEN